MLSVKKRIELPETFHNTWNQMIDSYNKIIDRVNENSFDHYKPTAAFETLDGTLVNLTEFSDKIKSILYKLRYASASLAQLREVYQQKAGKLEDAMKAMTESISEEFVFRMDVFFSFAYSAFDIVAGILHMVTRTGLQDNEVYFATVIPKLVSSTSFSANQLFIDLRKESESGWIYDLRQYRVFGAHYALVPLVKEFRYLAKDQSTEINLFMLPDNPKKRPFTYNKKRELVPYCEGTLIKEFDVMTQLFDYVATLV